MLISIIVAMDEEGGIGVDNQLPWHLPEDLKYFKNKTMGHHVIMGRKTFQSLSKPLPGRTNIVLTRNHSYSPEEDVLITHSLLEALSLARNRGEEEVFIAGGGAIYRQSLTFTDRLYMTVVEAQTGADVFFPSINPNNWVERCRSYHPTDKEHAFAFSRIILDRV